MERNFKPDSPEEAVTPFLGIERRGSPRAPLTALVCLQNSETNFLGRGQNISRNGICIQSNCRLREGSAFDLKVTLPSGLNTYTLKAVVQRINRAAVIPAICLQFIGEDPQFATFTHAVETMVQRYRLTADV